MVKKALLEIFDRDINKLAAEINLYPDEAQLWQVKDGISNSGGNLCLHLLGNLEHFIGATLGHSGYIRHRDEEFSSKNIPRTELLAHISHCAVLVKKALDGLSDEDFEKDFPLEILGRRASTTHMLIHLLAHLNYHLGQINYHRRMI